LVQNGGKGVDVYAARRARLEKKGKKSEKGGETEKNRECVRQGNDLGDLLKARRKKTSGKGEKSWPKNCLNHNQDSPQGDVAWHGSEMNGFQENNYETLGKTITRLEEGGSVTTQQT